MFCNHCGKLNVDDAVYCKFCGQKIVPTPSVIPQNQTSAKGGPFDSSPTKSDTIKEKEEKAKKVLTIFGKKSGEAASAISTSVKKNKSLIIKATIVVGILVIAILAALFVIDRINSRLSIEDYILKDLDYSGINGYGSIDDFNISDIIDYQKLAGDLTGNNKEHSTYSDFDIKDYISIKSVGFQAYSNLSNGDKLSFTISIDNEGIKNDSECEKSIREKDEYVVVYTVSGLEKGIEVDIFDAVDCYIFDDSSYSNQDGMILKKEYCKQYDNGIEVRTDDGLKVYGDNFSPLKVSAIRSDDKIVDASTKTVKCKIDCNPEDFAEYGIALSALDADIRVVSLAFAEPETISDADISELTAKANEYARLNFETGRKLEKVNFYYGDGTTPVLVYFYKVSEGYNAVLFEGLKIRSDSGEIYNVSNFDAKSVTTWYGNCVNFESIEQFEEENMFIESKSVDISS